MWTVGRVGCGLWGGEGVDCEEGRVWTVGRVGCGLGRGGCGLWEGRVWTVSGVVMGGEVWTFSIVIYVSPSSPSTCVCMCEAVVSQELCWCGRQ